MDAPIAPTTTPIAPPRTPVPSTQRVEPAPAARSAADRPKSFAAENASEAEGRLLAERSVDFDEATGSLIYRLIDVTTGFVTVQTPSDARLKMRAYIDGLTARRSGQGSFQATA